MEYEKKQKHETKTNDGENNENHILSAKTWIYRSIRFNWTINESASAGLNCTYFLLSPLLLYYSRKYQECTHLHIMITWCHAMRWPSAPNWQNISSERCKYNNKYANCDMLVHHYYIFDWANSLSSFVLCILSQKIALSKIRSKFNQMLNNKNAICKYKVLNSKKKYNFQLDFTNLFLADWADCNVLY